MCGILGKVTFEGPHEPPEVFDGALGELDHRGPDDRGTFHGTSGGEARISLGQTRLAILDLSEAGHQPMVSPRTGSCISFNGEVYNFREIRGPLEARGCRFASECDTEAILAAYDEYGEDFVSHLRGMFAIAIFDVRRQKLLLVRDRLGIKPLFYYWDGRQFAFASELTALAALPNLKLEVCPEALRNYLLQGFVPGPAAIFRNVWKLSQGHKLTLDLGGAAPRIERYWDPLTFYAAGARFRDEGEVLDALRATLLEAVKLRLISDVPLGAFLSGGVDSSLVVAMMRQVHTGPLRTFTVGFDRPEWNEAPAAKRIAEHLGTEHEEYYLSEQNVLDAVRCVGDHYDEPFADPSNIPTLLLCRETRRRVTVALSGDGGDELFWGYEHYNTKAVKSFEVLRAVPRPLRLGLGGVLKRLGSDLSVRLGHLIGFDDLPMYYMRTRAWLPWQYHGLQRLPARSDRMLEIGRRVAAELPGRDKVLLMGAMDLSSYLVDDILTKVDRASMAYALEVRVPVLDHKVVELAASIPTRFKTAGGVQKRLLKLLLGERVPRELWERPKMGFGIPLVHWFRTSLKDWAYDELIRRDTRVHDWVDPGTLREVLDDHVSGRRDTSWLIWACLQLVGWERRIGRVRARRPAPALVGN